MKPSKPVIPTKATTSRMKRTAKLVPNRGRMASAARAAAVAVVAVAVGAMAKLARAMAPSRVKGSSRR
jgi:hypothetical protein